MKYFNILDSYKELIQNNPHPMSILANTSAFLDAFIEDINWVGFYLYDRKDSLYLGPFQGSVACTSIALNRGVCGYAARTKEVVVVDDVHTFATHIACDSKTNSEVVLPIIINDALYGVLDIDSTSFSRFSEEDVAFLKQVVCLLSDTLQEFHQNQ